MIFNFNNESSNV